MLPELMSSPRVRYYGKTDSRKKKTTTEVHDPANDMHDMPCKHISNRILAVKKMPLIQKKSRYIYY